MATDVIIIGGGAIGLSIADTLADEGMRVTIVDAAQPGKGASWASAGVLAPQGARPQAGPYLDLCLRSRDLYASYSACLMESSGVDVEYRTEGGLHVAFDDDEAESLAERLDYQTHLGLPVRKLNRAEALEIEPALGPELRLALLFEGMQQVDNRKLVQALRVSAGRKGCELVSGAPVTGLMAGKDAVGGVETPRGMFRARTVINAAGAWSRFIDTGTATPPPVKPVKGQVVAFDVGDTTPVSRVIHGMSQYLVPRRDGRLLVGATVEKKGFDLQVTAGGVLSLISNAIKMSPSLADAQITETWAGLRPRSKDGRPILGPTSLKGYVMATGHFRNGILLAPVTAQLIRDYLVNGSVPETMKPFLLERFDA